jgi:hypothetical protein
VIGPLVAALGLRHPETLILAAVAECNNVVTVEGRKFYRGNKGIEVTNLKTIECAIGRVPTHNAGEFGIVDRSASLSRVLFTQADEDEDGGE